MIERNDEITMRLRREFDFREWVLGIDIEEYWKRKEFWIMKIGISPGSLEGLYKEEWEKLKKLRAVHS